MWRVTGLRNRIANRDELRDRQNRGIPYKERRVKRQTKQEDFVQREKS
jgi:hypothetical protein